jgi:hypothetical protein
MDWDNLANVRLSPDSRETLEYAFSVKRSDAIGWGRG